MEVSLLHVPEHLDPIFVKAIESIRTFHDDRFQTSFSPLEEQLTVDNVHKFFRNSYTNADIVIKKFDDIYKTLQIDSVSILSSRVFVL